MIKNDSCWGWGCESPSAWPPFCCWTTGDFLTLYDWVFFLFHVPSKSKLLSKRFSNALVVYILKVISACTFRSVPSLPSTPKPPLQNNRATGNTVGNYGFPGLFPLSSEGVKHGLPVLMLACSALIDGFPLSAHLHLPHVSSPGPHVLFSPGYAFNK